MRTLSKPYMTLQLSAWCLTPALPSPSPNLTHRPELRDVVVVVVSRITHLSRPVAVFRF